MTSIGDIEIELVFRIAIRGRTRDLAELTRTLHESQAVVFLPIRERPKVEKGKEKRILVNIGRVDS